MVADIGWGNAVGCMLLLLLVLDVVAAEVSFTEDAIPLILASVIAAGGFTTALDTKLEADKAVALLSMVGGRFILLLVVAAFEADGAPEIGIGAAATDGDDAPVAAPLSLFSPLRTTDDSGATGRDNSTWVDEDAATVLFVEEFIADDADG